MTRKKECVRLVPQLEMTLVLLIPLLQFVCPAVTAVYAPSQRLTYAVVESPTLRGPALNEAITPTAYTIHIKPNYAEPIIDTTTFEGTVYIDVNTVTTKNIPLHVGSGITIVECKLEEKTTGNEVELNSPGLDEDIYTIKTKNNVNGDYIIFFNYTGAFQEGFNGFYKSTYKKSESETGVLFTTQFQATHARKAFPCFDEPYLKATFTLKIDIQDGYEAISNTELKESSGLTRTFETTVKMSTYLLAFIVYEKSSYTFTVPVTTRNVDIKTWGQKTNLEEGLAKYSQEVTPLILEKLEDYTQIPYLSGNMKKIDQAAIPDFSAGAMENWGLVTYRDTRLLFNEKEDSSATKKSVAMIIGHELTHQWFGNLVTTKWWDTTWLNEGFARYMQYLILSKVYPSWRMMEQLLVDHQMSVFLLDSVDTALALTTDATTPKEISDRFGTITYSKGGSFLRMVSNVIGDDVFQEAMHDYLTSREFDWVIPKHLFDALDAKTPSERKPPSGDLTSALETWTSEPGFPVVNIERNYTTRRIFLTQKRFFADGAKETSVTKYNIPLIWSSKINDTANLHWFLNDEEFDDELEIENWMLVHARGYYRVNYDEGNWITLAWTISRRNRSTIAPEDRAQLFDDAFSLAAAGYLPYRIAEYMMRCLTDETDVIPWVAMSRPLEKLELMLGNINSDTINGYVRSATKAIYKKVNGFSKSGSFPVLVYRPTILRWACRAGNRDCIQTAPSLLDEYLEKGTRLDPNLKNVILCYGIMHGSTEQWNRTWDKYRSTKDETERAALISALGCSADRDIITLFLWTTLNQTEDQAAEFSKAFTAVLSHPKGIAVALDFVLEFSPQIRSAVSQQVYDNTVKELAGRISSQVHYNEVEKMLEDQFEAHEADGDLVDEIKAIMKKNVDWVKSYGDDALEALDRATIPEQETSTNEPSTGKGCIAITNVQLLMLLTVFTMYMNRNKSM